MKKLTLIVGLMCFAATCSATGDDELGVTLKVGSTGVGIDVSYSLFEKLNLRVGYSRFDHSSDVDDTDVTYDAKLTMSSANLLFDWHPFANGFRLSAGLSYYLDNEVTGRAVPAPGQTFTVNDAVYSLSELTSLQVRVEMQSFSPYIGIGWGNPVGDGRWSFSLDAGYTKIGPVDVGIGYTCVDPIVCASIAANVQAEIEQLEDDVDDFRYWPVLTIGLAYKI